MITTILELVVGTVWTIAMLVTMWMVGYLFTSRLYRTRELRGYWSPVPRWERVESMIALWPVFLWKIPERVEEHRRVEDQIEAAMDVPDDAQQAQRMGPPGHRYARAEPPDGDGGEDANPHPRRNVP